MTVSIGQLSEMARAARLAKLLDRRIIRTSYAKSIVYFLIAVALFLLFHFFLVNRPLIL